LSHCRETGISQSIYIEISISKLDVSDMGKVEILHQIKGAEEQVRAMTKAAEERRKQLQAEGKRRALEKVEAADAALRKQLDSKAVEARSQVERRKKAILDEGARKAEALTTNARGRSTKVKEFVLSEFERAADA
jgi:vacuolar-type H+-ATPase subunit H